MGKTRRYEQDSEFKRLRASKKQRNKKQRASKANLQLDIHFTNRNPDTGFKNDHFDGDEDE